MSKEPKERTINELRQVKSYGYTPPKTKVVNNYYRKVNFDPQYIVDLIQEYPNDKELGREIRNYYLNLSNEEIKNIETYISKLETELVMGDYNNGWLNKWYREKIKELKKRLENLK